MTLQIVVLDNETGSVERLADIPSGCYAQLADFVDSLAPSLEVGPARPGRPGIRVVVTKVEDPKLAIKPDEIFPSGVALSNRLGFNFNAVGQALSKSARAQEKAAQAAWEREGFEGKHTSRIRPEATLRGVTFMLEKDLPG